MRAIALLLCVIGYVITAPPPVIEPGVWDLSNNCFLAFLPALGTGASSMGVTVNLRTNKITHATYYEAYAAYHPTAKGIFLGTALKRPVSERTIRNKNIAIAVAIDRVIAETTLPDKWAAATAQSRQALIKLGVPLNCTEKNPDLAVGDCIAVAVANIAADASFAWHRTDRFNQLGDMEGYVYSRVNNSDWTGYVPKNHAEQFTNFDSWQPDKMVEPTKNKPISQSFYTPQLGSTKHFATDPEDVSFPYFENKYNGGRKSRERYFSKIQVVIDEVAITVDRSNETLSNSRKLTAEFFDMKALSFGTMSRYLYGTAGGIQSFQIDTFCTTLPGMFLGLLDSMIVSWHQKTIRDTPRPFSLIRHWKKEQLIPGWGGVGLGKVMLKGKDWKSYLPTDQFPDELSGTACFAGGFSGAAQETMGTDVWLNGGFKYDFKVGDSVVEPGIMPSAPVPIRFTKYSDVAVVAAESRVQAGVHTRDATIIAKEGCEAVGRAAVRKFKMLVSGL
jgi:hypothetical protein